VTANCLFCHSGRGNTSDMPIGCERCHGPGERRLAQPGGAIVNPAKLSPDLRDQVCEQCHLFGAARVTQPGRSLAYYDGAAGEPSLTGHSQEMKQSLCRQRSQGKLWCGSCHEVHAKTSYHAKCLNCHARNASAANREDNCVACHMPKRPVIESAHVTFTDHRFLRRPRAYSRPQSVGTKPDLAGNHRKVLETLRPLVGATVADAAFWQTLGEAHLASGEAEQAEDAFRQAVALDPRSASANYSLGYVFQLRGKLHEAIQAYRRALEADPYKGEALGNWLRPIPRWTSGTRP
jgi:tetratricopeptide (TPR) repeat protein